MNDRATHVLFALIALLLFARLAHTVAVAGDDDVAAVLRARTIELVDANGRVRVSLKTEPGGEVVLRMTDPAGAIRVKLGASADGAGLLLTDDRSEPGVHALAKRHGTSLVLAERGKERRVLEP